jgi:hypothetical protein
VIEALGRGRQEKRIGIPDGQTGRCEWQQTVGPLLRNLVALLAMKHGRAPLPVSAALWKGLLRRGVLNDLSELGNIARRYSFLGDERMMLAELRIRTVTNSSVRETLPKDGENAVDDRRQTKDGHKCQ